MGPGVRRDDESSVHGATPQQVVIPRACGVSSTLRLFDSITDASDYWIARFPRAMTAVDSTSKHESAFPRRDAPELCKKILNARQRAWGMPGAQCTPQPRVRIGGEESTRVFTAVAPEITRHPRTQWF
jgi:hypothetical protein